MPPPPPALAHTLSSVFVSVASVCLQTQPCKNRSRLKRNPNPVFPEQVFPQEVDSGWFRGSSLFSDGEATVYDGDDDAFSVLFYYYTTQAGAR